MVLLHILVHTTFGDASPDFDASCIEYLMLNADSDPDMKKIQIIGFFFESGLH
jgi:hypothetical protein